MAVSPDLVFMDGFDKYAPAGAVSSTGLIVNGEWTSATFTGNMSLISGLGGAGGTAISTSASVVYKDLGGNYARCIGGGWFSHSNVSTCYLANLSDGSTSQCSLGIDSTGTLTFWRGRGTTVLGTWASPIPASDINCIEWDIVVHNSTGSAKIYVNGTLVINLSGIDTASTANNRYTRVGWEAAGSSTFRIDHYYTWHYLAAGGGDTPALDQPVIETDFPTADQAIDWTVSAANVSNGLDYGGSRFNSVANRTFYRRVLAPASGDLTELSVYINRTTSLNCYVAIYSHNPAGVGNPDTRLGVSAVSTGTTAGVVKTIALTAPVSVVAGTYYWLAFIMDGNSGSTDCIENSGEDSSTTGRYQTGTVPATASSLSFSSDIPLLYGTLTNVTTNYTEVNRLRADSLNSVQGSTVGDQDLYVMGTLDINPSAIHMVALKAYALKSDAGAKQMAIQLNIGGTDYNGTGGTTVTPGLSVAWFSSYFARNPATLADWTKTDLEAAYAGYEITV